MDASQLLKQKIQEKEIELALETELLKEQFAVTIESLRPINLIKEAFTSPEIKNNVVNSVIGMTTGFIARKAVVRSSHNPLLKLLGTLIGMGVANIVTKHPEGVKSIGGKLLNSVINRDQNSNE